MAANRPVPQPRFELWFDVDGNVGVSSTRVQLLEGIAEHGSLVKAASALKMPFRDAWNHIREMQDVMDTAYIESERPNGMGDVSLTPAGKELVRRFTALSRDLGDEYGRLFKRHFSG